jgi:hypothetical protein
MKTDHNASVIRTVQRIASLAGMAGIAVLIAVLPVRTTGTGDPLLRWNEIMENALAAQNPFAAGRLAAITQVAVFEAVNSITGDYEPYAGGVPAAPGASPEAAVIAAAHTVLAHYLPAMAAALSAEREASLDAIPDGTSKTDGIAVGEAAAAAIIALRASDGATPPEFYTPSSSEAGQWQPTPACPPAGGVLLQWRNVAPFGIESSRQFRSEPPPALDSGEYAKNFDEVRTVGSKTSLVRPPDRADVAQFYNIVLAVGTWNPVARQLAVAQGTTLSENARAFALLNIAMHDALVSVMETKYHYTFWRPQTAIAAAASDGNPHTIDEPGYEPFVPTPCFPSYPSAHASAASAAARVVGKIWGKSGHALTLTAPQFPAIVLQYERLDQITADIDDARVYGGIHFRFDQEAGARQGRSVGTYVLRTLLQPVQQLYLTRRWGWPIIPIDYCLRMAATVRIPSNRLPILRFSFSSCWLLS